MVKITGKTEISKQIVNLVGKKAKTIPDFEKLILQNIKKDTTEVAFYGKQAYCKA